MSSGQEKLSEQCLTQAAEWYWTIREADVSDETIVEWQIWLSASSNHKRAFERIEAALEVAGRIEAPSWPTGEEIVADQYDGSVSVKEWRAKNPATGVSHTKNRLTDVPTRNYSRIWAVAASLLMGVLAGTVWQYRSWSVLESPPNYALYRTQPAEHRNVMLPDGSNIVLGGKSTISVVYNQHGRIVLLQEGEAYFDVAKDASRPFVVEAKGHDITAVGTEFNVSNQHARVVVTVTEGTVIVGPGAQAVTDATKANRPAQRDSGETARLEAGQKLIYDDQAVMPVSVANTDDAVAWRSGLLKYRGEKLRFVVEDVERYIDYPIILADPAVGEIQYTGTVFQDSANTWVYGLEDAFSIVVSDSATGIILEMNADGNQSN